ncbi:hypothetical protein [Natranaeroarchaeum aerophilus]|uniref:Uncharacterized protein n=1 Tax=Natranaeroarchaeum aerophilus TaxID=2917711 RepID=A0AAE3FNM6_9EURY|nr:hypothetical protein [Natranaeroarchaeum aerophilus]MCL9812296.1 hypothetical protein [Natranaeroarchaeum aerophilus]
MADNSGHGPKRRSILKQLGGVSAGTATLSSVAAASPDDTPQPLRERQRLESKYKNTGRIRKAVNEYASTLLNELQQREILPRANVSVLNTESVLKGRDSVRAELKEEGVAVTTFEKTEEQHTDGDAGLQPLIMISKNTQTHNIAIYIKPRESKSYAIVDPDSDRERFLIAPHREEVKLPKNPDIGAAFSTAGVVAVDRYDCPDKEYCGSTCSPCANNGRQVKRDHIVEECFYSPKNMECVCEEVSSTCGGDCNCSSQECGYCCPGDCDGVGW